MKKTISEKKPLFIEKGQVQTSINAVIALVVGVGVAVLILIFVGSLSGQTYNLSQTDISNIGNNTVQNSSVAIVSNSTASSLGHQNIHSGTLTIANQTEQIGIGNFSVSYNSGTITPVTQDYNDTILNASYNWGNIDVQTSVKGGIVSGFEALEQTGDYTPLIVMAIVIFIVLALVMGMRIFSGGNNQNVGGAL